MAELRVDILTLFPDTVNALLHESILGRAVKKGILDLRCTQIRDYTENRQCQVDDYPYGGGFGCVMMAQPLKSCLDAVLFGAETRRRVRNGCSGIMIISCLSAATMKESMSASSKPVWTKKSPWVILC